MVAALIRYLIGDTCADWLRVPRTGWDAAVKTVPTLLGVLETIEDTSPLGAWALDRLGHLTSVFELSSLTRGRVMQYAIPEHLKPDYGMASAAPASTAGPHPHRPTTADEPVLPMARFRGIAARSVPRGRSPGRQMTALEQPPR